MKTKFLFAAGILLQLFTQLHAQTPDRKFIATNDKVNAVAQSGDTLYIGGNFTQVGIGSKRLARFNAGSTKPDLSFPELGDNDVVTAIASDSAGGFYLGGDFTDFNGTSIDETAVIHVLANGTLDSDFATVPIDFDGQIITLKKDGSRLYVGGDFFWIQGNTLSNLAVLNAFTGVLENWQHDQPNSWVTKIDVTDSLVLINGYFNLVGLTSVPNSFAALRKNDGKLIPNIPGTDNHVTTFTVTGNTLYIGGDFTNLGYFKQGLGNAGVADANLNTGFPSTNGSIWCIQPDSTGGYYIGGSFSQVGDVNRSNIAHILADGTVDPAFNINVNNTVYSLAKAGANLFLCGGFTSVNGVPRNFAASISTSNNSITSFDPNANGVIRTIKVYGNVVYLGGDFTTVKNKSRIHAASITIKNALTSWVPSPDSSVYSIIINNNGTSAFLGGIFKTIRGKDIPYLARVNTSTGTPYNWRPAPDNVINSMVLNGKTLYIKGTFYNVKNIPRYQLAAIDTSTAKPTAFQADVYDFSYGYGHNELAIDNGKLYVAGNFSLIQDSVRNKIARFDLTSGRLDNWNSNNNLNPNQTVYTVCVYNNSVLFGGYFNFLGTFSRGHMAALDVVTSNLKVKNWAPAVKDFTVWNMDNMLHYQNNIFACGHFTYDTDYTQNNSRYVYNLIALDDSSGKISHQFSQFPDKEVNSLCIRNDKLILSGGFSEIDTITGNPFVAKRYNMASYNLSDYKLSGEEYNPNAPVNMIADETGNMIIGGAFNLVNYQPRQHLAAIDLKTGLQTSWSTLCDGEVTCLAIKDSVLFAGGAFNSIGMPLQNHYKLAALSKNTGQLIQTWTAQAAFDNAVYTMTLKDSTLYVGGGFKKINNVTHTNLVALSTTDGSVRPWNVSTNNAVYSILPLGNWIYFGGDFTKVNGVVLRHLARADYITGAVSSWFPNPDNSVNSIISSGKSIFVDGSFSKVGPQVRNRIAAFDTSGTLLPFNPPVSAYGSSFDALACSGENLYVASLGNDVTIGDSARGSLFALDTISGNALSFNPMPVEESYENSNTMLYVTGNKLIASGAWTGFGNNMSPSYLAFFTLEHQAQASGPSFTNTTSKPVNMNFANGSGAVANPSLFKTTIYPNPATNECTINFSAGKDENYVIEILDVKGNVLMHNAIKAVKGLNRFNMHIDSLPAGTFVVTIIDTNGKRESLKLIRQ